MAMVVELFIVETDGQGQDWRIQLHIPTNLQQKRVDQQFKLSKDNWAVIRPGVPIEKSDKYHSKEKLLDG
eukprot:4334408-Prorocentrum_lima.AAC.1